MLFACAAVEEGELSEDTIIANIMGAPSADCMTGAQAEYKDQIKAAIKKVHTCLVQVTAYGALKTVCALLALWLPCSINTSMLCNHVARLACHKHSKM